MNVTTKLSVDLTRPNVSAHVDAMRGDGNTRYVEIALLSDGKPWEPPEGVEAAIAYRQPGSTKGLYNKLADGSPAISISENRCTVTLAPQMLTASGTVQASLVFNDAQLNRLTTFPFYISVTANPAVGAQETEDYIRLQWLEDKLEEFLRMAADSGAFDGKDGVPGADGHTPEYGVDYGTPEQIAGIAKSAAEILRPDVAQLKQDIADLQYKPISVLSFGHNAGIRELGQTVDSLRLSWSLSKEPQTLLVNGTSCSGKDGSLEIQSADLTRTTTFRMEAADERGAAVNASTTVSFLNGVYYGVGAEPESVGSEFVLGLTKTLSGGKIRSFSVNAGDGEFIWYCLPSRFGSCKFTVGGFDGGFDRVAVLDFTNAYGYTEAYDVYRSANAGLGNTTVGVT